MNFRIPLCLAFLLGPCFSLRADEEADKIAAAKQAEAEFHTACQQWDTDHRAGKDMTEATKNLKQIYYKFRGTVAQTRYRDSLNNASLYPDQLSYAGQMELDGHRFSYITGSGQTGHVFSRWYQTEWTERSIPGNGLETMGIEPQSLRKEYKPGLGTWMPGYKPVLRIPYTLGKQQGQLDLVFTKTKKKNVAGETVEWTEQTFHPDHGTLNGWWWKPLTEKTPAGK